MTQQEIKNDISVSSRLKGITDEEQLKIILPKVEPKLVNNCPKCGLDLVERSGSKPNCTDVDCRGIILSNKTLKEWSLMKAPKDGLIGHKTSIVPYLLSKDPNLHNIKNTMDVKNIDKFLDSLSDEELKEKWNKYEQCSEQENSVTISEFIENIKQETELEEVAKKYANDWGEIYPELDSDNMTPIEVSEIDFIAGAKWQADKIYSEEEVIRFLQKYRFDLSSGKTPNIGDTTKEWFEQFKKK